MVTLLRVTATILCRDNQGTDYNPKSDQQSFSLSVKYNPQFFHLHFPLIYFSYFYRCRSLFNRNKRELTRCDLDFTK